MKVSRMILSGRENEINHLSKSSLKDQVKSYVCGEISSGRLNPGSKIPTQRELASMFDVSRKTCEVAMRELEFENIIFRRLGKGSFVLEHSPEKLFKVKSNSVVVCVPNFNNAFFALFVNLVEKALFNSGMSAIIARSNASNAESKKYISMLRDKNAGGIIGFTLNNEMIKYARNNNIPFVNIAPSEGGASLDSQISLDLDKAGRLAARHLIGQGHKKIVCAGGPFCKPDARFLSIADEMKKNGLSAKNAIITLSCRGGMSWIMKKQEER